MTRGEESQDGRRLLVIVAHTDPPRPLASWSTRLGVRVEVVVTSDGPGPGEPEPGAAERDGTLAVHRLGPAVPAPGRAQRVRAVPARAKTLVLSARHRLGPQLLWRFKQDEQVRSLLRSADVVAGLDPGADALMAATPDLLDGATVVTSEAWPALDAALMTLTSVLDDATTLQPARSEESISVLSARTELYATVLRATAVSTVVPAALGLAHVVSAACRVVRVRRGFVTAERLVQVLSAVPSLPGDRLGSGLEARRLSADLSLGTRTPGPEALPLVQEVARATLDVADELLLTGDQDGALALLGDALALLFNRALHAEVEWSPLVADPGAYLQALWRSTVFTRLVARKGGRVPRQALQEGGAHDDSPARPRVLVVPGTYGKFHAPVVEALQRRAEVTVSDLGRGYPLLKDRLPDSHVLTCLAAMTGAQDGQDLLGRPNLWDHKGPAPDQVTYRAVRDAVGAHDVVFCDWADRATVWVTHACPPRVKVVLRMHSLDVLDPWLHLTRWDRVAEVLVVSDAVGSLVRDLLDGLGATEVPVRTVPILTPLERMQRPKRPGAERTLGMIGWGRVVKDVAWTLDLLERLPGFRLVLIGAPFPEDALPPAQAYADTVRRRLAHLGDQVLVLGQTDDVAGALQDVGFIVSSSLREGCHTGLMEGAASGAVPVVRDWPLLSTRGGPRSLYPDAWVVEDVAAAVRRVETHADQELWQAERLAAQRSALSLFDPGRVTEELVSAVLGPS